MVKTLKEDILHNRRKKGSPISMSQSYLASVVLIWQEEEHFTILCYNNSTQ